MKPYNEEVLAGIEVIAVYLMKDADNKEPCLYLKHPNGIVRIAVEGDCCSSAFIDKVRFDLPVKLTGTYTEVSADNMLATEQDVDDITAVKFEGTCSKFEGTCSGFEHRNSSNGYYGNCWRASSVEVIPEGALFLENGRYGF